MKRRERIGRIGIEGTDHGFVCRSARRRHGAASSPPARPMKCFTTCFRARVVAIGRKPVAVNLGVSQHDLTRQDGDLRRVIMLANEMKIVHMAHERRVVHAAGAGKLGVRTMPCGPHTHDTSRRSIRGWERCSTTSHEVTVADISYNTRTVRPDRAASTMASTIRKFRRPSRAVTRGFAF